MLAVFGQKGRAPALVMIHGADGSVANLSRLARFFEDERPVYAIAAQALDRSEDALMRVEDLAAYYIAEMDRAGIPEPRLLLGYSYGGVVAFEMARQLRSQGRPLRYLGMLDTWVPSYSADLNTTSSLNQNAERKWDKAMRNFGRFLHGKRRTHWILYTLLHKCRMGIYGSYVRKGRPIPSWLRHVGDVNLTIGLQYRPVPSEEPMVLFQAGEELRGEPDGHYLGWGPVAPNLVMRRVPGLHEDLLVTNVAAVAEIIRATLPRSGVVGD